MAAAADAGVTVVIPAFRAAATVGDVVARVRAALGGARVIVVDDGSDDGTTEAATGAGAAVTRHAANRGKGAALATGIAAALAGGAPLIATLDADGQHAPEALPGLLAPLRADTADLVLGARARSGAMPPHRRLSNWLSAALVSRAAGHALPDVQTGFRAFRASVAAAVRPTGVRYEWEAEFLFGALAGGWRVVSVPVPTIYGGARSHFRNWSDTWRLARTFARHGRRILRGAR